MIKKYFNKTFWRLKRLLFISMFLFWFIFFMPAISQSAPNALVLDDLGSITTIISIMDVYGWDVSTISTLELIRDGNAALSGVDIVWISAKENYPALRLLVEEGGALDTWVKAGGVAVIMGLSPDETWLDAAFGGLDTEPIETSAGGTVTIVDTTHPMITGDGLAADPITVYDLDPFESGGSGTITNPPEGSVVVSNADGCIIADYTLGSGNVFISATFREQPTCRNNVLLYVESLIQ